MNNKEFIERFVNGATHGNYSNLHIQGDNLINYNTIIATRVEGGIALNTRKYSQSTSRIQNILRGHNVVMEYYGEPAQLWR